MINTDLSSEKLTEIAALTELIKSNKRRSAMYKIALMHGGVDSMTERIYKCMISESDQNIKELIEKTTELGIDVNMKEPNDLTDDINILHEENNINRLYERFLYSNGLGNAMKHIIHNQYKELKLSYDIIRMHDTKHEHAQVLVA
jgi:hypothetical protein